MVDNLLSATVLYKLLSTFPSENLCKILWSTMIMELSIPLNYTTIRGPCSVWLYWDLSQIKLLWISKAKTVTRILEQFDSENFGCRTSQIWQNYSELSSIKTAWSRINIRSISNICICQSLAINAKYISCYIWLRIETIHDIMIKNLAVFVPRFFRKSSKLLE